MKERPILFSAPMVRAILSGRKTQTRRLITHRHGIQFCGGSDEQNNPERWGWAFDGPEHHGYMVIARGLNERHDHGCISLPCPYGEPGDRLWVRETFTPAYFDDGRPGYRADWTALAAEFCTEPKWKPSIFMPRHQSRITLEVTGVRVERLQDISEADARAEGCDAEWCDPVDGEHECEPGQDLGAGDGYTSPRRHVAAYARLWDRINGKRAPWDSNPWVWVVEFRNAEEVTRGRR